MTPIAALLAGRDWDGQPGADECTLRRLVEAAPVPLPSDYLDLLRTTDGGHFTLTGERTYLLLWPAAEAITYNRDYEVADNLPGWFAIGDAGGLEVYALEHVPPVRGGGAGGIGPRGAGPRGAGPRGAGPRGAGAGAAGAGGVGGATWPVSVVPFVPMEPAGALPVAPDLRTLLGRLAPE